MSGGWQAGLAANIGAGDLEAQYKGSMLGNLWPLLNQVSQLLIYLCIFDCAKGEAESEGCQQMI